MNKKHIFFIIIVVICFACSKAKCPTPNQSATTKVVVDTVIVIDSVVTEQIAVSIRSAVVNSLQPTTNYGNVSFITAEAWTQSGSTRIQRTLIDFDYSSIPSGAKVTKALLTLYANTTLNYSAGSIVGNGHSQLSGSNSWSLSQITSTWDQQTVTWDTTPTVDNTTIELPASTSNSENYTIDITTFVKAEIANPTLYYGLFMKLDDEQYYRSVYFYSPYDTNYPTLHPTLVINYTN